MSPVTIAVPIPAPHLWRVLAQGEALPPGYMVALSLVSRQARRPSNESGLPAAVEKLLAMFAAMTDDSRARFLVFGERLLMRQRASDPRAIAAEVE